MLQLRQLGARNPRQQRRRRDDRHRSAVLQAVLDRRLHERFEQRADDRADLQAAEQAEIQLRRTRHENKYAVAFADAQTRAAHWRIGWIALTFPRTCTARRVARRCNRARSCRLRPSSTWRSIASYAILTLPVVCQENCFSSLPRIKGLPPLHRFHVGAVAVAGFVPVECHHAPSPLPLKFVAIIRLRMRFQS